MAIPIIPYTISIGGNIPPSMYDNFLKQLAILYINETTPFDRKERAKFLDNSIKELKDKPLILNLVCENGTVKFHPLSFFEFLNLTVKILIPPFKDAKEIYINEHIIYIDPIYGHRFIWTDGRGNPVISVTDVFNNLNNIKKEYEKPIEEAALYINQEGIEKDIAIKKLARKDLWSILADHLIDPSQYIIPDVPPLKL